MPTRTHSLALPAVRPGRPSLLGLLLWLPLLAACSDARSAEPASTTEPAAAPRGRSGTEGSPRPSRATTVGWQGGELPPGFAERIILITVDTLRADALGFAGRADAGTTHLDRLAAEGVYFPNAHAHNVMTLPSHTNMLTGRLPFEHGVRDNAGFRLDERWPTMATILQQAGWATAAITGAFPLDARYGLARGFDLYDDRVPEGAATGYSMAERRGSDVVQRGLQWWRERDGQKFLWLHLFDPHAPYDPPEPYRSRFRGEPYQGEVAATDAFLAPLFDQLRQDGADRTLVIFTSDHGEALGDHGEKTHGLFTYESTLRVPLVVWSGSLPRAGVDVREARHIDLLPTLLDAAGVDGPDDLPGTSLLRPAPPADQQVTYFEALGAAINRDWAPLRGVLRSGRKFIQLPLPELYHLDTDPAELNNQLRRDTDTVRTLRRLVPEASTWPPSDSSARNLSEDEARQLRALGYLSGSGSSRSEWGPEDDPKSLIEVDQLAHQFVEQYQARNLPEAVRLARQLVERRPTMSLGWYHLTQALLDSGDPEEALSVMGTAYRQGVASAGLKRQLALSLAEIGRSLEALQVLGSLGDTEDPDTLNVRALVLVEAGRADEARQALQRVFTVDPGNPEAHQNLARLELRQGRWPQVVEQARAAIDLNDQLPLAWNYLGVALYNQGRFAAALDAWQEATTLDPGDFDLLYNLAITSAEQGRTELARRSLERFIQAAPKDRYAADIVKARARLAELR